MAKALLRDAAVGLGISQAGEAFGPAASADRAAARATKEAKDQELRELQATKPTNADLQTKAEAQTVAVQNALEGQKQIQREGNKRRTYDAFDRYDMGGYDVRHINTMLGDLTKNNSTMYEDIARVDKVTEADAQLMENMGLPNSQQILSDPDVNASYVKATLKDGTTEIRSLDDLKGVTGYTDYASDQELTRQKTSKEIALLSSLGYATNELSREAFRRTREKVGDADPKSSEFQNAYTEIYDELNAKSRIRRGTLENLTEAEAQAKRLTEEQGLQEGQPGYDEAFSDNLSSVWTERGRPSTQRNLEGANVARAKLDEMDFFNMDPTTNLADRAKIEPLIASIEQSAGAELSTQEKATLERVNELTHLGDEAGELTDQQTGIIDRVFRNVSRYISDNTEGVQQEAAYAAYRNVVRHALFGSVLTPGETKSFVEQFGSLGQQRGPILAQLSNSLQQVKSNYETLVQTNDPYVIHHRTGMSGAKLNDVIDALDERIDMINGIQSGKPPPNPQVSRQSQSQTKQLADDTVLTDEDRVGLGAIANPGAAQ